MSEAMIKFRLDMAGKYLEDAIELFNQKRYNSTVSRAYYASYQAMWSVLGEPQDGRIWRHLAIIKHFVRGYWLNLDHPHSGPGLFEDKRLPLRRIYSLRIKSDYDAMRVEEHEASMSIEVLTEIMNIIEERGR